MDKNIDFDKFFVKSDLIPAIIQEKKPLKQATHGFGQEAVRSFGTRALHRDISKR